MQGDMYPEVFLHGKPGVRMGFQEVRLTPHIKTSSSPEEVKKFMEFVQTRCPVGDVMVNGTQVVPAEAVIE